MSAIKILKVGGSKDWTGDHGTFRIYDVTFESGDQRGQGQVKKKVDSPAPSEGETFEGTIVDKGAFPPELKRAQQAPSNGGGGGRAPMSPAKEAEIRRLACQKSAVALLVAEVSMGQEKPGTVSELLKKRIDWLEEDCIAAGEKAA